MIIIGGLDDQINLLIWGNTSDGVFSLPSDLANYAVYQDLFTPLVNPLQNNQPLFSALISIFLTVFGPWGLNLFIALTILANVAAAYFLFKRFRFGWVYTLIFAFSAYFWSHLGIHNVLLQLWMFPLLVYLLIYWRENRLVRKSFVIGLYLAACILISNYNAFIIFVFLGCYSLASLFLKDAKPLITSIISGIVVVVISSIFLFPYIQANYLQKGVEDYTNNKTAVRSYEDFFTFSSRPWYFALPPVKNPLLGDSSQKIVEKIEQTNYFLADDYFANEHQANYLGAFFLVGTALAVIGAARVKDRETNRHLFLFGTTVFLLVLLMLPPFFTFSGVKVYTPGLIMYKFFPMLRVTSRLIVMLQLSLLLMLASSVHLIYKTQASYRKLIKIGLGILLVATILETFVPPKIQVVKDPPGIYEVLAEQTPTGSKFAIYPFSKADEAFYWLHEHERFLANPRWYKTARFDSEQFTKELQETKGVGTLEKHEVDYLVVYREPSDEALFTESLNLELITKEGNYVLYKVTEPQTDVLIQ